MKHKFWIRVRFCGEIIDRFFLDYPKMNYFITKHNIKDKDIIFIKTRKEMILKYKRSFRILKSNF